jgi:hypothetical protein
MFFIQEHDGQHKILREMLPPGFGLRQPSGAFENIHSAEKRQWAAALQDASASR